MCTEGDQKCLPVSAHLFLQPRLNLGLELKVNVGDIFKRWTWRPVDGKCMMGHSDLNRHSLSSAGGVGLFLKAHLMWWRRFTHFFGTRVQDRLFPSGVIRKGTEWTRPDPLPWTVNIYSPPRETTVGYIYRGTPCGWIWVGGGIKWLNSADWFNTDSGI